MVCTRGIAVWLPIQSVPACTSKWEIVDCMCILFRLHSVGLQSLIPSCLCPLLSLQSQLCFLPAALLRPVFLPICRHIHYRHYNQTLLQNHCLSSVSLSPLEAAMPEYPSYLTTVRPQLFHPVFVHTQPSSLLVSDSVQSCSALVPVVVLRQNLRSVAGPVSRRRLVAVVPTPVVFSRSDAATGFLGAPRLAVVPMTPCVHVPVAPVPGVLSLSMVVDMLVSYFRIPVYTMDRIVRC